MLWIAVDCETTGLEYGKEDRMTELGWAVYDPITKKIIRVRNHLLYEPNYPPLTPFITSLTGLTDEILKKHGESPKEIINEFHNDLKFCTHIVAHNAPFDVGFLSAEYIRQDKIVPDWKIIDTSKDVPFPKNITTRKLTHLAAEHGFVNPLAHRAVTDVFTMLKILEPYDPVEIANWSKTPTLKIKALVTRETKELAKERGYRWDSGAVAWFKEIKELHLDNEIRESPFKIEIVETRNA